MSAVRARCLLLCSVALLLLSSCDSAAKTASAPTSSSAPVTLPKSATTLAVTSGVRVRNGPPRLSDEGRLLWNFEALLHATFGNADVTADADFNFSNYYAACGIKCGPSAEHSGYVYTFKNASDSVLHIAGKPFGPDVVFGAHPIPVLIKGLPVACNAAETKFLIRYGDTVSFTLGCVAPAN